MNLNNRLSYVLMETKKKLKSGGVFEYALEAELLIMHVLGITRIDVFTNLDRELSQTELEALSEVVSKRLLGFPIQYILGTKEFMGFDFHVNSSVLIPRIDTETLVNVTLSYIKTVNAKNILEIGTGSGCIAVSLAKLSNANVFAADVSEEALEVAHVNAKNNNSDVIFFKSDLFSGIPEKFKGSFDIIVSNPPYIPTGDIPGLMREVSFEPVIALDGREDGLYFYRKIILKSKEYLKDGGALIFEVGLFQGEAVSDIFKLNGFCNVKIIKDMENRDRVVFAIINS